MKSRTIYSFILDIHPKFAHQGWHLANSIKFHCGAKPEEINIHITDGVTSQIRNIFYKEGYNIHTLDRFGDGKWCNKLAQIPNIEGEVFDRVVLLDTDTIVISDLREFFIEDAIQAKIVDLPNPSLDAFKKIHTAIGREIPNLVTVDASDEQTINGNANGGYYAIPHKLAAKFSNEWRKWALWLLENDTPLRQEGKVAHIDQVSAALALHISDLPFEAAVSNVNYYTHFRGQHRYFDPSRPIALLHYHDTSMNVLGFIEPPETLCSFEIEAVERANQQISNGFHDTLFKNYHYAHTS